jgi:hypothetical protein
MSKDYESELKEFEFCVEQAKKIPNLPSFIDKAIAIESIQAILVTHKIEGERQNHLEVTERPEQQLIRWSTEIARVYPALEYKYSSEISTHFKKLISSSLNLCVKLRRDYISEIPLSTFNRYKQGKKTAFDENFPLHDKSIKYLLKIISILAKYVRNNNAQDFCRIQQEVDQLNHPATIKNPLYFPIRRDRKKLKGLSQEIYSIVKESPIPIGYTQILKVYEKKTGNELLPKDMNAFHMFIKSLEKEGLIKNTIRVFKKKYVAMELG